MRVGANMVTRQRTGTDGQTVYRVTHPVELLLQFFVGVVDAELLETVLLKRLEAAPTEKTWRKIDSYFNNY